MLNKLYIIIIIIILIIIVIKVQYYFKTIEEFTTEIYVTDDRKTGKYGIACIVDIQELDIQEPVVASGDIPHEVIPDTDYKYLAFTHSGGSETQTSYTVTFDEPDGTECDILIVGGGGAGGNSMGGGGGAGGVVYTVNQTLSGSYVINVGKGGDGIALTNLTNIGQGDVSNDGNESSILNMSDNYISLDMGGVSRELRGFGGGGGGVYYDTAFVNGRNGGSGGGSAEGDARYILQYSGGSSIQPNTLWNGTEYIQGGSSGNGNNRANHRYQGGGGGGAGNTNYNGVIENGKTGVQIPITNENSYYAAGGGGGQYQNNTVDQNKGFGGSGIGGNGRIFRNYGRDHQGSIYFRNATSGQNNTGSGGGGGAYKEDPDLPAGSGGSGIVIIRYKSTKKIYRSLPVIG